MPKFFSKRITSIRVKLTNYIFILPFVLFLSNPSLADIDKELSYTHPWQIANNPNDGNIILKSKNQISVASFPTEMPEAILTMDRTNHLSCTSEDLKSVSEANINYLNKIATLDQIPDLNGVKPDNKIISYMSTIDGKEVVFIKYRIIEILGNSGPNGALTTELQRLFGVGADGKKLLQPIEVTQVVLRGKKRMLLVTLFVLSNAHAEEVQADQVRMIRRLLQNSCSQEYTLQK